MSEQRVYMGRDAILALQDLGTDEVFVEPWGTYVRVKSMSAGQRNKLATLMLTSSGRDFDVDLSQLPGVMANVVAWCVVDETGKRLFADSDVDSLNEKHGDALQTIFEAAMRVSGLGDTDAGTIAKN